jgi:hypothetical protein
MDFLGSIGNDILDIGSRKAENSAGDPLALDAMMGRPGQFEVPNVNDVRILALISESYE